MPKEDLTALSDEDLSQRIRALVPGKKEFNGDMPRNSGGNYIPLTPQQYASLLKGGALGHSASASGNNSVIIGRGATPTTTSNLQQIAQQKAAFQNAAAQASRAQQIQAYQQLQNAAALSANNQAFQSHLLQQAANIWGIGSGMLGTVAEPPDTPVFEPNAPISKKGE